ncbi:hypothetical protein [Sphingobacterium sp. R2]|uniref:type I restriction endonuclease subunit R, EcoR124 family n=1 Tax=Sphingobacterium sp. R2 TaxID=3112958 RepID=UPI00345CBC46
MEDSDTIPDEFKKFWNIEQESALQNLIKTEKLLKEDTERLIENYLFTERESLRKEVLSLRDDRRPSVLKSKAIGDRILNKILGFVDTFVNGITGT